MTEVGRWRASLLSRSHVTATPSFSIIGDFFFTLACCLSVAHYTLRRAESSSWMLLSLYSCWLPIGLIEWDKKLQSLTRDPLCVKILFFPLDNTITDTSFVRTFIYVLYIGQLKIIKQVVTADRFFFLSEVNKLIEHLDMYINRITRT